MKDIIFGGAGFIGSHLTKRLVEEGDEVTVFDNFSIGRRTDYLNGADVIVGDVLDRERLSKLFLTKKFDRYFYLASIVSTEDFIKYPMKAFKTTLFGVIPVADEAVKNGKRLIFFSTSEVYGEGVSSESDWCKVKLSTREGYDVGKLSAEGYLDIMKRTEGLKLTTIRPFNVYGENEYRDAVIPKFITQLADGKDITVYNEGFQRRTFTYISDFIDGLMIVKDVDGVFNIAGNENITIYDLASIIAAEFAKFRAVSSGIKLVYKDIEEIGFRKPDIRKIESLGYYPKVTTPEGLNKTIKWYLENHIEVARL